MLLLLKQGSWEVWIFTLILNKLFKIPVSLSMYVLILIVLAQFGFLMLMSLWNRVNFIYTMVIDKILVMGAQKIEVKIISSKYEIRKAF
ncbi:MAG: hypothetical protein ACLR43_12620 [Faecalibacillus faecis]